MSFFRPPQPGESRLYLCTQCETGFTGLSAVRQPENRSSSGCPVLIFSGFFLPNRYDSVSRSFLAQALTSRCQPAGFRFQTLPQPSAKSAESNAPGRRSTGDNAVL